MKKRTLTPDEEYYLTWIEEISFLMEIRPPCNSRESFLKLMGFYYDKEEESKKNPEKKSSEW